MKAAVEISSEEVLVSVKLELRLTNTDDQDNFLDDLIDRGARRLGTTETYVIKDCEVESENNGFNLPKDAKQIIAFRSENSCWNGVFVDVAFFTQCGCNTAFPSFFGIATINGRRVHFLTTVPDSTVFKIAYTLVNRDSHGFMKINEETKEALVNYTCWKYSTAYERDFTPEQRASWKKDYQDQAARCRGLAARRTFEKQRAQISSKMNAILSFDSNSIWFGGWFNNFLYSNNPANP